MSKGNTYRIYLSSYDHKLLDSYMKKIVKIVSDSGAKINGPIPLPTNREMFTVLRSPHVNKKSKKLFERRTHKRMLEVSETSPKSVVVLSNFSLPASVGIEIKQRV